MAFLYNFGLSQEDARTEAAALKLSSNDRVISIASAGEMPLSLAAMGARVTAVDIDPAQIALTALKLAAVRTLPREQAIGFLGYQPIAAAQRLEVYPQVCEALQPRDQAFWDQPMAQQALAKGAIWAGRFERYIGLLTRLVVPLLGRRNIEGLFECTTLAQQQEWFDRRIGRPLLRWVFRVAFSPRVFSGRGMDPRSLAHRQTQESLGDQYYGWFRSFCTANLARENHLLQLTLLGRVLDSTAVPEYLSPEGYAALRARPEAVQLHWGDIIEYLEQLAPASFDKAHLSNICDWMEQTQFDQTMRLLASKAAPGARIVWRFLHVDRVLPTDMASQIVQERELGQILRAQDRYPFYSVVPAHIVKAL